MCITCTHVSIPYWLLISEVSGWCAGPLFVKTNDVLRNKGKTKGGNNYSNVIHAILRGISKLSQVSGIPDNRTLFRGTGGMRLPNCFYVEDETGVRGGVERALLSTTTARAVAMHYIDGRDLPTVCCTQVIAVSKGASLSHISQFPGEDEVMQMILLLFLQKQNLASAIYLFGLGTRLSGPGLKHMR